MRPAHELIKQIKLREEARRRAARSVPVLLERQEQQSEQALKAEHAAQRELVRLARAAEREALAELSRAKQEPRVRCFLSVVVLSVRRHRNAKALLQRCRG